MSLSFVKLAFPAFAAVALLAGAAAWSQEEPEAPAPVEENGENAAGEARADEREAEDDAAGPAVGLDEIPELDEQTYEKDDDEFIPTEEIPVDQSIPFPTDI